MVNHSLSMMNDGRHDYKLIHNYIISRKNNENILKEYIILCEHLLYAMLFKQLIPANRSCFTYGNDFLHAHFKDNLFAVTF